MKRIKRASIILVAVGLVVSLTMVIPASAQNGSDDVSVLDSEFVMFTLDSTGEIEEAQVFSQLSLDGKGKVTVREEKAFEEVGGFQGVKGFTTPKVEGDYIVWPEISVDGPANILASTKLSEPMVEEARTRIPLDVDIKYWFDGVPVTDLDTITGKDGRFKVEMTLTNTSKEMTEVEYEDPATGQMVSEEVEVYLPTVILPYDWYFDNQVFFNLEADPTASIVPMPDFYNVGWSIPLFPPATEPTHTIWVAGDVIDFQMPPLTLAVLFHFPQTNQADTTATVAYAGNLLYDGIKQVNAGIGSPDNTESLIGGITAVDSGLQQLGASLPEAPQAIATQIKPGVDEMAAGLAANLPLIGSTVDDPDTLLYAAHALVDYLDMIQGLLGAVGQEGTIINDVSQVIAGLSNEDPQGLLQKLQGFVVILDGVYGELTTFGETNDTIRGLVGISPTMAADEKQALFNKMDAVAADVQSVESGLDGAEGSVGDLLAKVNSVSGSLGLISFIIGSPETDPSLLYAAVAIEGGLKTLRGALSTGDPADPGLYEGLVQVSGGLDQLTSGLNTAVAGIGSAGTPDTLLYGTNALASGLTQLKNEGTMALEDGLHTLLATLSMTHAQLEAITERGEEFDHFLGRAEDADNQVRFVYQTKPTYNYKTGNTTGWVVAVIISVVIALILVAGGILLSRRSSA